MLRCVILVLMVSACGSLVPSGAARLAGLSPLNADPAGFVVSLSLPEGLDVRTGSAQIALTAGRSDSGEKSIGTYVLNSTDRDEGGTRQYRVDPGDLDRFRNQQAEINRWRQETEDVKGSFSVTIGGCALGAGPAPGATVSVAMRTRTDQDLFDVLQDAPVSRILREAEQGALAPCS